MPRADRVHSTQRTRAPSELHPARASANRQTLTCGKFAEGSQDQSANLHFDPVDRAESADLPTRTLRKFAQGSADRRPAAEKDANLHPSSDVPEGEAGPSGASGGSDPAGLLATLQRLRSEAACEVERLLAFLDETDADADLEPSGDEAEPELGSVDGGTCKRRLDQTAWADGIDGEPSLGAAEHHPDVGGIPKWAYRDAAPFRNHIGSQEGWSTGSTDERERCADLEEDEIHDGAEPDVEDEPSLGSINPTISGSQIDWAAGESNDSEAEHDGAEPDADGEPSLGSFDRMADQWHANRQMEGGRNQIVFRNSDTERDS